MLFVAKRIVLLALGLTAGCSSPQIPEDPPPPIGRAPIGTRLARAEMENLDYESGPRGPMASGSQKLPTPEMRTANAATEAATRDLGTVANISDPSRASIKASSPASKAGSPTRPQIIGQIVRGTPALGRSIATVDVERCFDLIPSYRKVHAERSSKEYARYLLLLTQANDEFRQAVDWIALREGVDVVVEKGGVVGARTVDITSEVCERLREQRGDYTR